MPPKKIYVDIENEYFETSPFDSLLEPGIEYIRADIVVKAIHGAKRQLEYEHDRDKGAQDALSVLNKFLALTGHE